VDLSAEINFPNLALSATCVAFGSVLNDTTKREHITIKNTSSVPARYEWVFVTDEEEDLVSKSGGIPEDVGAGASKLPTGTMNRRSSLGATSKFRASTSVLGPNDSPLPLLKAATPEQVFDILPIRGFLQPGEEEVVEVSYFAAAHSHIAAVAVCEVQGGPSYDVRLSADAASIRYSLDCGTVKTPKYSTINRSSFTLNP
jgi:hydrocephalus-inducing protein